ncbi:Hypothetical protein BCETI_1000233 [Brucella ceti str. Cudo]|uniref:Uncharacterized protein n=1 Tax=Brucella ceti str. Cudo TaxID=595497 RepID=C0G3J9_9HYPH|nr:Hypothetical protein BCETI_1000233 [Brucella ceti str. Cudo]
MDDAIGPQFGPVIFPFDWMWQSYIHEISLSSVPERVSI